MTKENLMIFDHPLINHKIAILRDEKTSCKEFREIVEEIAILMSYEALRDVPTKEIEVKTPLERTVQTVVEEKSIAIVPVLRAGLGMVGGLLTVFPTASVGHIGLYRDELTHDPVEYYVKLPEGIESKIAVVVDPMLATGGSAVAAIDLLKRRGCKRIKLMCVLGAPEGVACVTMSHPDVEVYLGKLDRELNEHAYILPGLGDAGDRIFGTK